MVRNHLLPLAIAAALVGFSLGCLSDLAAVAPEELPVPYQGGANVLQINFADGSAITCSAHDLTISGNPDAPGGFTVTADGAACPPDAIFKDGFE